MQIFVLKEKSVRLLLTIETREEKFICKMTNHRRKSKRDKITETIYYQILTGLNITSFNNYDRLEETIIVHATKLVLFSYLQ